MSCSLKGLGFRVNSLKGGYIGDSMIEGLGFGI